MKVLLALPTLSDKEYLGSSSSLRFVANNIPSLGLGYLATALEEQGEEVAICDPIGGGSVDLIASLVSDFKPDILGLSVMTPHLTALTRLHEKLEKMQSRPLVVLGGSHISTMPLQTMEQYSCVDLGVVGEGENTLCEIVGKLRGGKVKLTGIIGTVYREDGIIHSAPMRPLIQDLDTVSFPARHLMAPLREHRPTPASIRRLPLGVMMTSRGCPYRCVFCDRAVFGATYRRRSPENVLEEIKVLVNQFGAKEIRFFDDDLAIVKNHGLQIAEGIAGLGFKLPWTCMISAKNADEQLFRTFKESGCWQVLFGLESGNEEVLKQLKKPTTLEISRRAVGLAKKAGLRVRADFLVGTPGETIDNMWETVHFAIDLKVDFAHFNKFVPLPGTELYEQLLQQGWTPDFNAGWSDLDNATFPYLPEGVTENAFRRFLDKSFRAFYLRPEYILKRLMLIRSWDELKGYLKGFFAILFL